MTAVQTAANAVRPNAATTRGSPAIWRYQRSENPACRFMLGVELKDTITTMSRGANRKKRTSAT